MIDNTGLEPGTNVLVVGGPCRGLRGVIGETAPSFSVVLNGEVEAQFPVLGTVLRCKPTCTHVRERYCMLPPRRQLDEGLPPPGRMVLKRWIKVLTAVELLGELG